MLDPVMTAVHKISYDRLVSTFADADKMEDLKTQFKILGFPEEEVDSKTINFLRQVELAKELIDNGSPLDRFKEVKSGLGVFALVLLELLDVMESEHTPDIFPFEVTEENYDLANQHLNVISFILTDENLSNGELIQN